MMKIRGNPIPDHVEVLGDDAVGFYVRHGHELHARAARDNTRHLMRLLRRWAARKGVLRA